MSKLCKMKLVIYLMNLLHPPFNFDFVLLNLNLHLWYFLMGDAVGKTDFLSMKHVTRKYFTIRQAQKFHGNSAEPWHCYLAQ